MRKSMSLAEEGPVAIDTRVGALGQKNHSLDTRKDLAPTSPPLHQGQLRAVVGFTYTWLDIHLPGVDFQPLVRNPTICW